MRHFFYSLLILPLLLCAETLKIDLHALGSIVYHFNGDVCEKIVRLSPSGDIRYEHTYHYDADNRIVSESLIGSLGEVIYSGNVENGYLVASSPFGEETWSNKDRCTFEKANLTKAYDIEGRLTEKGTSKYFYEKDNLVRVSDTNHTVLFNYDDKGRKISKKTISDTEEREEHYLYLGQAEIGSISNKGNLNWLRIPGITTHKDLVRAIAIETESATFAPIYDLRWNIVKLVDIEDGTVYETRPDPFGQNLAELEGCPWTFCSKRYDKDTNLVDFGYRHYDIDLKEWTTLDPLMQDTDPYRYCFNNPLQFLDPDGRAAAAVPIISWVGGVLSFPLWGPEALAILAGAGTAYLGHEIYKHYKKKHTKLDHDEDPPYTWDDLGADPSKCPGEGFEWRGKSEPKDGQGNWYRKKYGDKEHLNPDLDHPEPIGPHWDYYGPKFPRGVRIHPDGWEQK